MLTCPGKDNVLKNMLAYSRRAATSQEKARMHPTGSRQQPASQTHSPYVHRRQDLSRAASPEPGGPCSSSSRPRPHRPFLPRPRPAPLHQSPWPRAHVQWGVRSEEHGMCDPSCVARVSGSPRPGMLPSVVLRTRSDLSVPARPLPSWPLAPLTSWHQALAVPRTAEHPRRPRDPTETWTPRPPHLLGALRPLFGDVGGGVC